MEADAQLDPDGALIGLGEHNERLADHEKQLGYNPHIPWKYDPQLEYDRRQSKNKLRQRFQHIYDKYEKDFGTIGDEIDVDTGEIVVDNGHLRSMRHEADTGEDWPTDLDREDDADVSEEDSIHEGYGAWSDGDDSEDDSGSVSGRHSDGDFSTQEQDNDSATSLFDADDSAPEFAQKLTSTLTSLRPLSSPLTGLNPHSALRVGGVNNPGSRSDGVPQSANAEIAPENIFDHLPAIGDSVLAFQSKCKQGQAMDQDSIKALGMNIANQLAQFMAQSEQTRSMQAPTKSLHADTGSYQRLPRGQRKRETRSLSPKSYRAYTSPNQKSLWAPLSHPRPRKRRRLNEDASAQQNNDASDLLTQDGETIQPKSEQIQDGAAKRCTNCGCTESYAWRGGPNGILCNTCGMYYYRYGLMKPLGPLSEDDTTDDSESDMDPLRPDSRGSSEMSQSGPIGANNARFSVEDDALLIKLKEVDLLSWETIAVSFPGRSAYAVQCRYSKKLRKLAGPARDILVQQGYQYIEDGSGCPRFAYSRDAFKEDEDELLLKLRDVDELEWEDVASLFQGRTPEVLELRYRQIAGQYFGRKRAMPRGKIKAPRESTPEPGSKNQRYTAEEDELIVKLREVDKLSWPNLALLLPGRNTMSLQKRYVRVLSNRGQNAPPPVDHGESLLHPIKPEALGGHNYDGQHGGVSQLHNEYHLTNHDHENSKEMHDLFGTEVSHMSQMPTNTSSNHPRSSVRQHFIDTAAPPHGLPLHRHSTHYGTALDLDPAQSDLSVYARTQEDTADNAETVVDALLPEPDFTKHEDELILKLRDLEALPWDSIAAELPDRTVSAISARYYHYLQPKKALGTVPDKHSPTGVYVPRLSRSPSPGLGYRKRWTPEELGLVADLRKQGLEWAEIASRVHGRTAIAIARKYNTHFSIEERHASSQHTVTPISPANGDDPLLKRAVKTSARRYSESTLPPGEVHSGELSLGADFKDTMLDDLAKVDHARQLATSGLSTHEYGLEERTTARSDEHEGKVVSVDDKSRTQVTSLDLLPSPIHPSEKLDASQYHSAAPEKAPEPSSPVDIPPCAGTTYCTPGRSSGHGNPYYLALLAPRAISPSDKELSSAQLDAVRQSKPGAHRVTSQNIHKRHGRRETTPVTRAHRAAAKSRKALRIVTKEQPPEGDVIEHDDAGEGASAEEASGDESADNDYRDNVTLKGKPAHDRPDDEAVHLSPPPLSKIDLIIMAMKANGCQPMRSKEICASIEDSFSYFKNSNSTWKVTIRATLSKEPQFQKLSDEKAPLWALTDAPISGSQKGRRQPRKHHPKSPALRKPPKSRPARVKNRELRRSSPPSGISDEEESLCSWQADEESDSETTASEPDEDDLLDQEVAPEESSQTELALQAAAKYEESSSKHPMDPGTVDAEGSRSDLALPLQQQTPVHRSDSHGLPSTSSIVRVANIKRVVQTPARELLDDSEDELA